MEKHRREESLSNGQLKITILRHSVKGPDGNLNEEGKAKASSISIPTEKGARIEIFTSDIQRSKDTGKIIGDRIAVPAISVAPILSEYPFTDEKIEELGLSGGKWLLVESVSQLLAAKISKFTLDKINSHNPNDKSHIIAISHVPPIMAFLGHVLAWNNGQNSIDAQVQSDLFESFGGFVKPLEGFEIVSNANTDSLLVTFTNHSLQIPTSLLHKLSSI